MSERGSIKKLGGLCTHLMLLDNEDATLNWFLEILNIHCGIKCVKNQNSGQKLRV